MVKTLLVLLAASGATSLAMAQNSKEQELHKNVIKLELTHLLYPHSFVMSYERVTKPNESFCITGGYEEFPPLVNISSTVKVRQDLNRSGFKAGAEYRFYLKKENKYQAPHGMYLGPYVSYHSFYNTREIEVNVNGVKESANLSSDFHIINLGLQFGHQFVFNNRWTLDVVTMGPAISNYLANLKMDGQFTFDKEEVENEIVLKLLDRFPMLEKILTDKEVSSQGRLDNWAFGWRFQCNVGYSFGRKRK
jgi:hypothetical protein